MMRSSVLRNILYYLLLGGRNIFVFACTIINIPVYMVQCMNDLGICAARDLLRNALICTLVFKCNRMMGMIKHYVGWKASITVTSHLYIALNLQ